MFAATSNEKASDYDEFVCKRFYVKVLGKKLKIKSPNI